MRLSPTGRAGLTLLEVLVALAIFMLSLAALTHLVTMSSNLAVEASHRSRAAQLARSKMAEFACGAQSLASVTETPFDDEPDYAWSADVEQGASMGLWNITVRVRFHPDDPFPVEVALSSVLLDPQYVGSTQDVPASPTGSSPDDSSSDPSSSSASSSGSSSSSTPSTPAAPSGGAASGGSSGKSGGAASGGSSGKSGGAASGGAASGGTSGKSSGSGMSGSGSSGSGMSLGSGKGGSSSGSGMGGKGK